MTTHGRINHETLSAFLEGLPDLLESLRAQGYGTGPSQHIAAYELIGSLFARGSLPPTLLELGEWLAPLVCNTPEQQEDFSDHYLRWLVERRMVAEEELPPPPPPLRPPPPPPRLSAWERFFRRVYAYRWLLVLAGAALIALVIFAANRFGADYLRDEDLTKIVVLNPPVPDPTPVPLPSRKPPAADPEDGGPTPPSLKPTLGPRTGRTYDADKPGDGPPVVVDLSQVTLDDPPPPRGFWVRYDTTLLVLATATPFAGLWLWHFLGSKQRRRDAERWRGKRPRYDKIKVRGARERVFQSAALRPVARGLRHYLSVDSGHLDARSTILASVGRGGLFTPVYGRRRTLPEYLVLIDHVGFSDQLAQFHSDIVTRLREKDVYLDTYYFHGDPRHCSGGAADSPQLSLDDLAARHPDHYLLIFGDGTGLMSTMTGRPEPFIKQLLYWRGRALLTPVPRLEWGYREWALEREGLKVLPASLEGLRLLGEAINTDARAARAPRFDETPPYPDILREQPALWKERDAPPNHQVRRLVTHLRRYLGPEGFELLCACAVYPVMQWGVTLFLAYEILGRREVDEVLPRLLRLPWFRNGTMPPWLRRVLVLKLPRAHRRLVRERLGHLLLTFLEDPERGLQPRLAKEQAGQDDGAGLSLLPRIGERLAVWRRGRILRGRLEYAPARSPLAEPVFLDYITNNGLAVALPAAVRRGLFRRGIAAFGLRLAPALALVAVVALTALTLLLLERPTDDIYTPGAPPDLMSLVAVHTSELEYAAESEFLYTPKEIRRGETVTFEVEGRRPNKYDFLNMILVPADEDSLIWSTLDLRGTRGSIRHMLVGRFTASSTAPLGRTELLVYDGSRLKARLPITIGDAFPFGAARAVRCPDIDVSCGINTPGVAGALTCTAEVRGAPPSTDFTYDWNVTAPSRWTITSGRNTPQVSVEFMLENASRYAPPTPGMVRVTGLSDICPDTTLFALP